VPNCDVLVMCSWTILQLLQPDERLQTWYSFPFTTKSNKAICMYTVESNTFTTVLSFPAIPIEPFPCCCYSHGSNTSHSRGIPMRPIGIPDIDSSLGGTNDTVKERYKFIYKFWLSWLVTWFRRQQNTSSRRYRCVSVCGTATCTILSHWTARMNLA